MHRCRAGMQWGLGLKLLAQAEVALAAGLRTLCHLLLLEQLIEGVRSSKSEQLLEPWTE